MPPAFSPKVKHRHLAGNTPGDCGVPPEASLAAGNAVRAVPLHLQATERRAPRAREALRAPAMTRLCCGVDFGTTNSAIGMCPPGGDAELVAVDEGNPTIPSAMFFGLDGGGVRFGRAAVRNYMDGADGRFMRALKSVLGTGLMKETTLVGRDRISFQGLIGRFLGHLRERYVEQHGNMPDEVVFGRPVHFVDDDEAADRTAQDQLEEAARLAGFSHVEFQFEPIAAALHVERRLNHEALALVVDIGGGTSDFCVLRLSPERARKIDRAADILSTGGVHVGGTDFDRLLSIARVMPHFGLGTLTADRKRHMPVWYFNDMATWHKINQLYTPKTMRDVRSMIREAAEPEKLERYEHLLASRSGHRLAAAVENAKIALTDRTETTVALDDPGLALAIPVSRAAFEQATDELVRRVGQAIDETLKLAAVEAAEIDTVILTGGGAQVPVVRAAATARFPAAAIPDSDQFGSVGLGLAVDAARRFG